MVRSTSGSPTATIEDIPPELLNRFCKFAEGDSLKQLRLSSKALCASATALVFACAKLLPDEKSSASFIKLVESDLAPFVTDVLVQTSFKPTEDNYDRYPAPNYYDRAEGEIVLQPCFKAALCRVGKFPKAHTLKLLFSEYCNGGSMDFVEVAEEIDFRTQTLQALLSSLASPSSPEISCLVLENWQNKTAEAVIDSPHFQILLANAHSLALKIANEQHDAAPELEHDLPEAHLYYAHYLKTQLLLPVTDHLRELKLYATLPQNMYWGYYPFCDLRDPKLHFPNLKTLALGQMSFAFDWQLDWILSHAETLESLVLNDCPITIMGEDDDNEMEHPHETPPTLSPEGADLGATWSYDRRWYDYFDRIKEALTALKYFGFKPNYESHSVCRDGIHDSAFHDSSSLGAELNIYRYKAFSGGTFATPGKHYLEYVDDRSKEGDLPNFGGDWGGRNNRGPLYPDCWHQDKEALQALLAEVASRV